MLDFPAPISSHQILLVLPSQSIWNFTFLFIPTLKNHGLCIFLFPTWFHLNQFAWYIYISKQECKHVDPWLKKF